MKSVLSKQDMQHVLDDLRSDYHVMLSKLSNADCPAKKKRDEKGCFDVIGNGPAPVAENIAKAKKFLKKYSGIKQPKFLDCGCGFGNIMLIAYSLGCHAYGIDLNERALKLARLNKDKGNAWCSPSQQFVVYRRDILTYKDYGKYDIVYYYCPMRNGKLERQFEQKVADDMRVGAVILPFYSVNTFMKDKRFVCLCDLLQEDKEKEYFSGQVMQKIRD